MFAERGEQPFRWRFGGLAAQLEIFGHGALGRLVERHQPLLAALAAHHQHALIAPRGGGRQRHQFGDAQAGGIDDFEQARSRAARRRCAGGCSASSMSCARLRQETVDLGDREHLRQRCARAWALPAPRPDRRRVFLPRRGNDRAGAPPTAAAPARTALKPRSARPLRNPRKSSVSAPAMLRPAARRCARQIGEVVAIGGKRILAGAAFGRQHVEEQFDQRFVGCVLPAGHRLARFAR